MNTPDFSDVKFFKSSHSGDGGCVEIGIKDGHIGVRDSKNPEQSLLVFYDYEWKAFIQGVKQGEFDLG